MAEETKSTRVNFAPHAFGMVVLVVITYLMGMLTNLFVAFPEGQRGEHLWEFAKQQILLVTHMIFGFLLLLGTIALFARAIRVKNVSWIIASCIALAAVVGAIIAGATFVPSQSDIYSFVMATCFIIALLGYFWGLYVNK